MPGFSIAQLEYVRYLAWHIFSTKKEPLNLQEGENELDPEIVKSFNIAEEAFLFFDASQDGFMDREEVMKALSDTGSPMKGKNTNWNINNIFAKRFAELDWDNNGQISFKEFLYAVEGWVLDEGEDASGP